MAILALAHLGLRVGRPDAEMLGDTILLVNPAAAAGRPEENLPRIISFWASHDFHPKILRADSSRAMKLRAVEAVEQGITTLIVFGGDGAFHHVAEAVWDQNVTLGLVPGGAGNDVAASLGIPLEPVAAAGGLLHYATQRKDLIRARFPEANPPSERMILGAGGLGLDAEAAQLANRRFRNWPSRARYVASALAALWSFRGTKLWATIDEQHWQGVALLAAVANGPFYGAGMKIAPEARMDDGWLDVTIASAMSWHRALELMPVLQTSGRVRGDEIHQFRARRASFRADPPVLVHGDGEILGESPVEFEVLPKALRILAPESSPS